MSAPDKPVEHPRSIKSFVMRTGRMTESQKRGLEELWPKMGLDHEQPFDNQTEFGRQAPLVFEIGFGMGDSVIDMAKTEPEKDFVGVEVHLPGVGRLLANAEKEQLSNIRVYKEDAVEILKQQFSDQSIDRMQLYFPDPWHKKRHHKRRIVQPEFVQLVRQKLKIGGVWHMATDWENYAEHMMEVMSDAPGFANLAAAGEYVPRPEFRPETKFERRGERLGHGVWDLMFKRID